VSLDGGGGGDVPFSAVPRRVVRFLGASFEVEASGAAFLLRLLAAFGVGSSGASSFRLFRAERLGVAGEGVILTSDRISVEARDDLSLRDPIDRVGLGL
jgi:hypothetical protein